MNKNEIRNINFSDLGRAIVSLRTVLEEYDTCPAKYQIFLRDSCIQRFEFSVELYWKVLKKILASRDIFVTFGRDAFRKAYQQGLIDNEETWLMMLDDRNDLSHNYQEHLAENIFEHIKIACVVMEQNYEKLKILIDQEE